LSAGDLSGKVVLVTGASSGIGAALARAFADRGARLVLAARRLDRLQALVAELAARAAAIAVPTDVTQDGQLQAAVEAGVRAFGALDVAVANAGFGVGGDIGRLTVDDFRRQMETNFFGVLRTAEAALPELRKTGGRLAIIGSVAGHVPGPRMAPYAASKFALRGYAESIHDELAPLGVTVTLISPGFVVSDIGRVDNKGRLRDRDTSRAPPWLRVPADRAARQMVAAIAARRREAVITGHGKLLVWSYRHLPWAIRFFTARAGRTQAGPRSQPAPPASQS
jgi:NAD(P)-dependent dehydrogenase (short-subunit alcohol dehydrogenase family)